MRRAHMHVVVVDGRFRLTDRCQSGLLWWTIARAVALGQEVRLGGRPLVWDPAEARRYLAGAPAKWRQGLD